MPAERQDFGDDAAPSRGREHPRRNPYLEPRRTSAITPWTARTNHAVTLGLLGALVTLSTAYCRVSAAATSVMIPGPHYVYKLTSSTSPDVCSHMNDVFNEHFAALWDSPMLIKDDPSLAVDGPYAFSTLPGVDHDYKDTFAMLASKTPSSPEFDAVPWKEGRAVLGEPPASAGPQNDTLRPILVAYFDFYNDGHVDTVVKTGFSRGYSYMANSGGNGLEDEWITIVSDERVPVESVLSLWKLERGSNQSPHRLATSIAAAYERPFIYRGVAYLAQYDIDLGKDFAATSRPPYKPRAEHMTVVKVHPPQPSGSSRPPAIRETVCRYSMTQTSK